MGSFRHFVITRFDLRANKWRTDKNNQPTLSDQWYAQRFKLFRKYCLGSILAQTNPDFDWIIVMDTRTDDTYRTTLSDLIDPFSNIHLINNVGFDQYLDKIMAKMKAICMDRWASIPEHFLTSRLDNDDCLHPEFIAQIQSEAKELTQTTLIDATTGFYVDPKSLGTVEMQVPNNPFLSLFEPTETMGTVLARMHQEWAGFSPRINLSQPLWATVVHRHNLRNRLPNMWRTNPTVARDFGAFFPVDELTWTQRVKAQINKYLGNITVLLKRIYYPTKRALVTMLPRS